MTGQTAPRRIQRRRVKGWRAPEGAIYVGRPSRWGNPYTEAEMAGHYPGADRSELARMCASDFRGWIKGRWDFDPGDHGKIIHAPTLRSIRVELAGHDLMCWCPLDQPCHADVLLELANGGTL